MQQAPLSPGTGSLDRLDSLDEYFMLNSPPDSPQQPNKTNGRNQPDQTQAPIDIYGYYIGSGSNGIASQGNVKQSTCNITVDRSNALERNDSLGFGRMMPNTQRDIDGMLKMEDKDISDLNLTELFLKSSHRTSLNENYQAKGALKGHDKDLHRNRSNSLSSSFLEENERNIDKKGNNNCNESNIIKNQTQIGAHTSANAGQNKDNFNANNNDEASLDFDLDVEPTPLAEIRAKSEERKRLREEATRQLGGNQEQQQQQSSSEGLTAQKLDQHEYEQHRRHRLKHGSNYYPFGRSYQLPIPTMPPISPPRDSKSNDPPLADAVATAAALASVQETKDSNETNNSTTTNAPNPACQRQESHTPPTSPPLQPTSQLSWPKTDGSRLGSVHSNSPHHQSHSSPTSAPHQQPPSYSHPQHPQQQHHPSRSLHHSGHHQSYPVVPHHLATPLAVGTMPPGMHSAPRKIIGPYTTAQQGGNSNSSKRRATASTSPALNCKTSGGTTTKAAAAPAPPAMYLPRRGDHMPREASAAHTKPKAVLTEAAKARRGHIGFHKPATSQTTNTYHHPLPQKYPNYAAPVPAPSGSRPATPNTKKSTPPPPLAKKPGQTHAKPAQPATLKSYANGAHSHHHRAPASAVVNPPPADTAYERKKQRAKDARVKLNESIERLHVAMGVAGSESKKRTEQLRNFMKDAGREHENHTDHQAFELMESCVKTAESAKKWDRPNFVGSAATMISCLNSQCEILMKELMEYQEAASPVERPGRPAPVGHEEDSRGMQDVEATGCASKETSSDPTDPETKHSPHQYQPQQQEPREGKRVHVDKLDASEDGSSKRRRLNGVNNCVDEKKEASATSDGPDADPVSPDRKTYMTICVPSGSPPVQLEDSLMELIASFLDPMSLVQCCSVCKGWKGKHRCFERDKTWTNLCLKRFGQSKTRQWQEKQSECDDDLRAKMPPCNGGGEWPKRTRGMSLYRSMSSANVMPPIQFNGRSHVLIGRGRLPGGGAAAWLFLVERSNGETMRSVKRNPAIESSGRNAGVYSSLPVVEVRIVIQNIGVKTGPSGNTTIAINRQRLTVDASTRRRGDELLEIDWDDKFVKKLLNTDGSDHTEINAKCDKLARLGLFDVCCLVAFIHARRCSTTTRFLQRSNFMRVLVTANGRTQALVIPISNRKMEF